MSSLAEITINIDGAARGNPGPAAFAYVLSRDGEPLIEEAGRLGTATNNYAEYTALIRALERAAELGGQRLLVRSDSELLVKQMNGEYRVKNEQLKVLHDQAQRLRRSFASVTLEHVPRVENSEADRLCNEVLDGLRDSTTKSAGSLPKRSAKSASSAPKQPTPPSNTPREDPVREAAVRYLRSIAATWSPDEPVIPSPEEVWDNLWKILEANGVRRSAR
jgi:ribonuclease HI